MSMTLEQAFAELRTNEELARRFSEKPEEVLKELGVEEENLQIALIPSSPAPKTRGPVTVTSCASVGLIGCASVGTSTTSGISAPTSSYKPLRPGSVTQLPTTR